MRNLKILVNTRRQEIQYLTEAIIYWSAEYKPAKSVAEKSKELGKPGFDFGTAVCLSPQGGFLY